MDRTRPSTLTTDSPAVLPGMLGRADDEANIGQHRVLLLLEDLGGGTGNHVCQLVALWKSQGWNVAIVAQKPPLVRVLPEGVEIRVTKSGAWYDRVPIAQIRRLSALRRIVRELRPDVVHTYFFWSIMYGRMLKLFGDVPVLVENREDMGFSWGRGAYFALRMTRAIPDRVICVAEAVRAVAIRKERLRKDRTMVVRNGIAPTSEAPTRETSRREFGFGSEHVVVGMVANLPRTVKGGRQLLDVVRAIVNAAPNVRFLLVGVGADEESLRPELDARGITDYVVGAGYRRDVETCYAAMDISVLTSSTEGLSITLLESMRSGLPTVATDVGGNGELVVEGETGFLVPFGDFAAFVARVVTLAGDAALRHRLGNAGRRRIAEQFAVDTVGRTYLEVYQTLTTPNRGTQSVYPELPRGQEIAV